VRFQSFAAGAFAVLEDCLALEHATDRLSRNVGKQLPTYAACTSQKRETSIFNTRTPPVALVEWQAGSGVRCTRRIQECKSYSP
jgi:hypothetical protein